RRRGGVVVGYRARAGFLFFFSGRRRHTGFSRDWSSDVCSSDLRGAEIQEQIKDPWDRPYIPGSSLKGALRTAIAFVGAAQRKIQINPAEFRRDSRFAAQPLEQKILNAANVPPGKVPNYDLLRALQISDTTPADRPELRLLNAQ